MKFYAYFMIFAVLFLSSAFSESYGLLWNDTLKLGTSTYNQYSSGVVFDSEGSLYSAGSFDYNTMIMIKYNSSSGQQFWNKTFTGYEALDLAIDSDDNLYLVGQTTGGGASMILVKYNSSGSQLWNRTLSYGTSAFTGVAVDGRDETIVATGYYFDGAHNNFRTIKFYPNGTIIWDRIWNMADSDSAEDVAIDSNGSIVVVGRASGGISGMCIIKYNENGTGLWNRTFDDGYMNEGWGITFDLNNDIIIAAASRTTSSTNLSADVFKYSSSGTQVWRNTYETGSNSRAEAVGVDYTGNITVVGYASSAGVSGLGSFIRRFYSNGTQISNMTYWDGDYGSFMSVTHNPRGDIAVGGMAGTSSNNTFVTQMYEVYPNPGLEISVTSPVNGTEYGFSSIPLDVSSNLTVDSWKYSLNGGSNVSFVPNTTIVPDYGVNQLWVYASNSSLGKSASYYVVFNASPDLIITVSSPANGTYYTQSIPLNVNSNIVADWSYSLDGGSNVTFVPNVTLPMENGPHTLWIYASNSSLEKYAAAYLELNVTPIEVIAGSVAISSPELDMACMLLLFAFSFAAAALKK